MFLSEQIQNRFHRIECNQRSFHKHCVPIAHGAVPEPRQFLSLQLPSMITFLADESCRRIYKILQGKFSSQIILGGADNVNRIEMGGILYHIHDLWIVLVQLGGFKDLKRS